MQGEFRTPIGANVFYQKYALTQAETWHQRALTIVDYVCGTMGGTRHALMSKDELAFLVDCISNFKFMPGGRYIYYAGREAKYYNNCYLLKAEEDTREEWGKLSKRAMDCLMSGGGIGVDYSILRPSGRLLSRTGGRSSGPIPLMHSINEIGRNVMQGGSRRSAIYASLNWQHDDAKDFITSKDWHNLPIKSDYTFWDAKQDNFNFPCPLDMTNISLNYDNQFLGHTGNLEGNLPDTFMSNVRQAMSTGEPGFSFNFGSKENETLRNAPLGPDTYVLTTDGYKQIRDIVGNPCTVWTGKQWAETTFKKTGEMVPVVKVDMSGGRSIIADPTHEFFLDGGGKVPAAELKGGDSLLVQLNNEVESYLYKDFYTLGYIYGDGSFSKRYPRAEVTFCTYESKQCLDFCDKDLFSSINHDDSRGYTRAYTKNNKLFNNRHKEVFPEQLLNSTGTAQQVSFIAGLFDSDGSYDKDRGMVRLASKHEGFLHGVRRLLESLGIMAGVTTAGISTYGGNQGYMLYVYAEYVSRFALCIPTHRLKVKEYKSYRKNKIKVNSVTEAGFSDVYCCDVGVEEHSFMAEGVIVSNCCEVTSEDDSDVCNLGSVNMGAVESLEEFKDIVRVATKFLVCGTVRADLPYKKISDVREKNRRLGLGLMGVHEWLLKRNYKYEVNDEFKEWLKAYKEESDSASSSHSNRLYLGTPVANRAIAPTGTIGLIAGTTTGIEPLFAVAYKRRYLVEGTKWKYEYVVDGTADNLIKNYGLDPDSIETALTLAGDMERRVKFQADVQDYVDMAISSTCNLPEWGSKLNNEDTVKDAAKLIYKYAPRLRGLTFYPDGSRGGQPLTSMPYEDAIKHKGVVFEDNDSCAGGVCGV